MQYVDVSIKNGCKILPFTLPKAKKNRVETTDLAALIAVTILHDANVSAEERLAEIIEQTGEVELMDTGDVITNFGLEEMDTPTGYALPRAVNDNAVLKSV